MTSDSKTMTPSTPRNPLLASTNLTIQKYLSSPKPTGPPQQCVSPTIVNYYYLLSNNAIFQLLQFSPLLYIEHVRLSLTPRCDLHDFNFGYSWQNFRIADSDCVRKRCSCNSAFHGRANKPAFFNLHNSVCTNVKNKNFKAVRRFIKNLNLFTVVLNSKTQNP